MLSKDDLKAIVDVVSPLIDARAKTTETLIKGEINSVKETLRGEITSAKAELQATLTTKADKADIQDLDAKLVKRVNSHEKRIDDLEKESGLPNPHKN